MRYVYIVYTCYNYGKLSERDVVAAVCMTEKSALDFVQDLVGLKPKQFHYVRAIVTDKLVVS